MGGPADSQGNGVSSLTPSPKTVGDAVVLLAKISSATTTISSVSGGGAATWSKVAAYEDTSGHDLEVWLGTVTQTGGELVHSSCGFNEVETSQKIGKKAIAIARISSGKTSLTVR